MIIPVFLVGSVLCFAAMNYALEIFVVHEGNNLDEEVDGPFVSPSASPLQCLTLLVEGKNKIDFNQNCTTTESLNKGNFLLMHTDINSKVPVNNLQLSSEDKIFVPATLDLV